MIISEELRHSNIAEYILYMWQTEDLIRSFEFDIEKINKQIVENYDIEDKIKNKIQNWYKSLIQMMDLENIKYSGHLQVFKNIVNDLNDLHLWLLTQPAEIKYRNLFDNAKPNILELAKKMKGDVINEVDICLHGLYAIMLLKLQKKEINSETNKSIETFRYFIAFLVSKYHDREKHPEKYYQ